MKKVSMVVLAMLLLVALMAPINFAEDSLKMGTVKVLIDGKEVEMNCVKTDEDMYLSVKDLNMMTGIAVEKNSTGQLEIKSEGRTVNDMKNARINFNAEVISNNSVGNEWNYYVELSNITYYAHQQDAIIPLDGSDLEFELVVYEYDESKSDFGRATVKVPYSDVVSGDPLTFSRNITVQENGGQYSGNTAEVVFTLNIEVIK